MDSLRLSDWVYFKLYVGQAVDKLDHMIVDVCPALARAPEVARWFYLRYVDEGGVHLRVRAQAAPGRVDALRPVVAKICDDALGRVPQYPPAYHRPMALPDGAAALDFLSLPNVKVRLDMDTYEPELDKFGGAAGMPLAEALFQASSEAAWAILRDERAGKYSRKTLAPCLMESVRAAFAVDERAQFWRDYSLFWLGGASAAADDWRDRFSDKAQKLRASGVPVMAPEPALPVEARAIVAEWRAQLGRTAAAYQQLGDAQPQRQTLSANFIHLMNNRLGLVGLEEAYLGALLEGESRLEVAA
jgi:thiopeptide-type bacteriocin biosynthesis protein